MSNKRSTSSRQPTNAVENQNESKWRAGTARRTAGTNRHFSSRFAVKLLVGLLVITLATCTAFAARDEGKKVTDKKTTDEKQQSTEKGLSVEEAEFERRMNSIAKTIEKEDRPSIPEFTDRPGSNGVITFDDLKFEMKKSQRFKRDMLTNSVNSMVGERLKLKGYIHPNSKKRGMRKFIFVRDDKECCFGPTAALYDCVLVTMAKGEVGKYSLRPVTVEGEFFLKEFNGPDGRVWAIYRMKNGVIK